MDYRDYQHLTFERRERGVLQPLVEHLAGEPGADGAGAAFGGDNNIFHDG